MCSALLSSSSVSVQDVYWGQLLEGRSNVFIAAIDELATGHVIGDPLGLPELPGKRPFSSCHHLKIEHFKILVLAWMFL